MTPPVIAWDVATIVPSEVCGRNPLCRVDGCRWARLNRLPTDTTSDDGLRMLPIADLADAYT
jgi:N6-adenosine-specific RNA methylase IME4